MFGLCNFVVEKIFFEKYLKVQIIKQKSLFPFIFVKVRDFSKVW